MEASQETCFGAKITQDSLQIIKRYVPKKNASIQSYLIFLKANVEKLERNYIGIWGPGAMAPRNQRHFKNQIKCKPDISLFYFWQSSLNPQKYVLAPQLL